MCTRRVELDGAERTARQRVLVPPTTRRSRSRGQSITEYALFIAVVAAALLAMFDYVRRSIQANLKAAEVQINAESVQP